ncbi:MAG: hypothetical protein GXO59_03915 [Dictyoglomi bacterium]|nr:hypothetical protein [Dictyoglomota bacterium]
MLITSIIYPTAFASKGGSTPGTAKLEGYMKVETDGGKIETAVFLKNTGDSASEITFNNKNYTFNVIVLSSDGDEVYNLGKEKLSEGIDIYATDPITITINPGETYKLGEVEIKDLEEGTYKIQAEIFTNPIIKLTKSVKIQNDKDDNNKGNDNSNGKVELSIAITSASFSDNLLNGSVSIINKEDKDQALTFSNKDFLFNVTILQDDTQIFNLADVLKDQGIDIYAKTPTTITFPANSTTTLGSFSASITPGDYKITVRSVSQPSITWSGYLSISASGTVTISDKAQQKKEDNNGKQEGKTEKEEHRIQHHAGDISVIIKTKSAMLVNTNTATFTVYFRNNSTATLNLDLSQAKYEVAVYLDKNKEEEEVTATWNFTASLPETITINPKEVVNAGLLTVVLPKKEENAEYTLEFKLENIKTTDGTLLKDVGVKIQIRYFYEKPKVEAPSWADDYFSKAIEYGLIYIPENGEVNGDQPALRRDVIYAAAAIAGVEAVDVATTTPWSDVTATDPMAGIFLSLYEKGLLKGYPDGTLRPDQPVTRAEAITLFLRIIAPDKISDENIQYRGEFKDVSSKDWYAKYVEIAYRMGLVKGDGKGHFMPNKKINLSELAVIAVRAYEKYNGD